MYLESIAVLREKEAALKKESEDRALLAKKAVADARIAGEESLREASAKAEAEVKQMLREVNEKAIAAAADRASATENKKAVLLVRAERNRTKAAALIVERIVNG